MACGGGLCGVGFDLRRQREALEQLRREVEALDETCSHRAVSPHRAPCGAVGDDLDADQNAASAASVAAAVTVATAVADWAAGASLAAPSSAPENGGASPAVLPSVAEEGGITSPRVCRPHGGAVSMAPGLSTSLAGSHSVRTPHKVTRADEQLESTVSDLQSKSRHLATELQEAESELRRRGAARDTAKSEWSKALSQSAAAEGREERRLAAAKKDLEEARQEETHADTAFRFDREKLRQRLRNLRMQLKQADQKVAAADEERGPQQIGGASSAAGPTHGTRHAQYANGCSSHRSRSSGPSGGANARRGSGERTGSAINDAKRSWKAFRDDMVEFRQRRDELLRGQQELQERERGLRKASRLTDAEIEHWEKRSELRDEEARLQQEQEQLRAELQALDREADHERQEAARFRVCQERALAELGEREIFFKEHQAEEVRAICTIDEFLNAPRDHNSESRQAHLAEWLEADIGTRQVEHMKKRLAEIVADAGARAQVLEQAVGELHADLDRRAAIIIALVDRQGGGCTTGNVHGAADYGSYERCVCGNLFAADSSFCRKCGQPRPQFQAGGTTQAASLSAESQTQNDEMGATDESSPQALERKALEVELEHQRGLFELRGEQVLGLEQRLAALLAREAPRVNALRSWVAVHESLAWQRLEACQASADKQCALREDVEAMRRDKTARLTSLENEWRTQRNEMAEVGSGAKRAADEAAQRAAALQRRREVILRSLEQLLKVEGNLATKTSAACQAVERDQRRLVDLTARQMRVASAAASGAALRDVRVKDDRGEAARQALQDAREAVEESRSRQVNAFIEIQREAAAVNEELRRVAEAMESAEHGEQRVQQELAEAETAVESSSVVTRCNQTPRQATSRRFSAGNACERQRVKLEQDLEAAQMQLRQLERGFEDGEAARRERCESAQERVEQASEALASEKAKHKASSSGVLKRYRSTHAALAEAEQSYGGLQSKHEALSTELAKVNGALEVFRERQRLQRPPQQRTLPGRSLEVRSAEASSLSRILWGSGASELHRKAEDAVVTIDELPSDPSSPPLQHVSRALPSLAEVKERSAGNPELYTFYLQVLPLLKGIVVGVACRRAAKTTAAARPRFEPRQLSLSSDLQRLELWPAKSDGARSRRRVAEAFFRIESLARVHVPKATLAAVQHAIANVAATVGDCNGSEVDGHDRYRETCVCGNVFVVDSSFCRKCGKPRPQDSGGDDDVSGKGGDDTVKGNGTVTPNSSTCSLPFDVVLNGAEPWRLQATDVHTFHVVTTAMGILVTVRAMLPSYAITLGIGAPKEIGEC